MRHVRWVLVLVLLQCPGWAAAEEVETEGPSEQQRFVERIGAHLKLDYYWDDRELDKFKAVFTATKLPLRSSYFIYGDLNSIPGAYGHYNDYYIEGRLSQDWWRGLGPAVEHYAADRRRSFERVGILYKLPLKRWLANCFGHVKLLPLDTSGDRRGQMGMFLYKDFLERRVFLKGWYEYNWRDRRHTEWVSETQVGVRLYRRLYAVAQYRESGFLTPDNDNSVAIGLEWRVF